MTIIDRTCTEVQKSRHGLAWVLHRSPAAAADPFAANLGEGAGLDRQDRARPIDDYRDAPSYVLLGDPGAGKTTCFQRERALAGDAAELISARDFVTFDVDSRPEWRGKTLFIDGLDEVRAGSRDGRTDLDQVRAQLDQLGRPRFRLSCREADWLGRNDLERLEAVAPDGDVKVLRLDPLTRDDARRLSDADERVANAEQFLQEAEDRGLQGLLANPQNLNALIGAVGGSEQWPASRLETFEIACQQLATEANDEHRYALPEGPAEAQIMDAAGRICALLLLSGTPGTGSVPTSEENDAGYPAIERLDPPQPGTTASEDEARTRLHRWALSSRLFAARNGRSSAGRRHEPVHRHIAEFLAGRYLARLIESGLPTARVVALITGPDGGVVTPHRGLSAWLAAQSKAARRELIDRDPVGVGLYGDIAGFSAEEERALLQAVSREIRQLNSLDYYYYYDDDDDAALAPPASPALEAELRARRTLRPESGNLLAVKAEELREGSPGSEPIANSYLDLRRRREQEWLDAVRGEATALAQNRGAPKLLFDLARRRLKRSRSEVPLHDWLRLDLGNDADLARAAAKGLRGVIDRDDVPDVDEILRLHGESHIHYLSTPFLVSLDERGLADARLVETMTEQQRRQACAFYCSALTRHDAHPKWYRELVAKYPQTVASVLLSLARTELQAGREHLSGLWDLAHDAGHAELARLVAPSLLRGFPVRCHVRQLPSLIRLLWSALQHANRSDLIAIIEKKLASKSMTVNQRVHWLAAGVIAAPDSFSDRLNDFVDGKELRGRQLARFLWSEHPALFRPAELPPRALEVLIEQSGAAFGIYDLANSPAKGGLNAQPESTLWRLSELIDCLAASTAADAGKALNRLAKNETLARWRRRLRTAADRQATVARDASYECPDLDRIRATLNNAAPANVADLAALAIDRLDELSTTIRHSNTNLWRQFWNEDEHGRPIGPKPENSCRDALLSHLGPLLPTEVEARPEAQYAAGRRADIRLSCSSFHVPIEIKKQSSRDLYRAARDQLVARYARHPATGGHGIFLALWFGDSEKVEKAPLDETGTRPGCAEELQRRLEARLARQLPSRQLRKIAVRVIDVSKPLSQPPPS